MYPKKLFKIPKLKRYSTVTRALEWCQYDLLDYKPLKQDEMILVKWPNQTTSIEFIQLGQYAIYRDPVTTKQMQIPYRYAYVNKTINGKTIEVPLIGLDVKRLLE